MSSPRRFTFKASSGQAYELVRATPLTLTLAEIPTIFFTLEEKGGNLDQVDPSQVSGISHFLAKLLTRHMISPRFFDGHPAEAPKGWVALEDLGDDALEIVGALLPIGERGTATMSAARSFPEEPRGGGVPGDVQDVPS